MALVYSELERIKSEITQQTEELNTLFNQFTQLINDNVSNQEVWYGTSSQAFKTRWDEFADTKFPEFRNHFQTEIDNIMVTLNAYKTSEQ